MHARGDDACELEWHGRYEVPGEEQETGARQFIEGAYATMFSGIQAFMTRDEASA